MRCTEVGLGKIGSPISNSEKLPGGITQQWELEHELPKESTVGIKEVGF